MSDEQFKVDVDSASDEEIQEALELLTKKRVRQHKIDTGQIKGGGAWADKTEEQKEKSRAYNRKRTAKLNLLANKAIEAGIEVTDEEVEAAIAATT